MLFVVKKKIIIKFTKVKKKIERKTYEQIINTIRVVGIFKSEKKMVAYANHFIFSSAWWTNNSYTRFCISALYLCYFLKPRNADLSLRYEIFMKKKIKIVIEKKKKRVPVPQKPPKVEKNPKAYDRDEEKKKIKKKIQEELN